VDEEPMTRSIGGDATEAQRQVDLLLQIERFIRYAPMGTQPEILQREAREFESRLSLVREAGLRARTFKLQERLRRIYGANIS
jgi:hypothetical protein